MTGDFAVPAYTSAFLDLDKRTDLAVVTNFTPVEIYEIVDDHIAAGLNIGSYYTKLLRHESEGVAIMSDNFSLSISALGTHVHRSDKLKPSDTKFLAIRIFPS